MALLGSLSQNRILTFSDLAETAARMASFMPDIGVVMGISRSGMIPASIIAAILHTPLYAIDCRSRFIVNCGGGFRFHKHRFENSNALIVDDTVAGFTTMASALSLARHWYPQLKFRTAALFVNPDVSHKVDYAGYDYPLPHFLLWNFANTFWSAENAAFDIDGFIVDESGHPIFVPRLAPIIVITGRLRKHEDGTRQQLESLGVKIRELYMLERGDPYDLRTVIHFKASVLNQHPEIKYYFESEPEISIHLAKMTKTTIICPRLGTVLNPRKV